MDCGSLESGYLTRHCRYVALLMILTISSQGLARVRLRTSRFGLGWRFVRLEIISISSNMTMLATRAAVASLLLSLLCFLLLLYLSVHLLLFLPVDNPSR